MGDEIDDFIDELAIRYRTDGVESLSVIEIRKLISEVRRASGVPLGAWQGLVKAAFGTLLFTPFAVAALEARVSGVEVVRFACQSISHRRMIDAMLRPRNCMSSEPWRPSSGWLLRWPSTNSPLGNGGSASMRMSASDRIRVEAGPNSG